MFIAHKIYKMMFVSLVDSKFPLSYLRKQSAHFEIEASFCCNTKMIGPKLVSAFVILLVVLGLCFADILNSAYVCVHISVLHCNRNTSNQQALRKGN